MELPLPVETESFLRGERQRGPVEELDLDAAGARRFVLPYDLIRRVLRVQISGKAAETAVELLLVGGPRDVLDGRAMRLGGKPRALVPERLAQLEVARIERFGEVRGGESRHAVADLPLVEQGDPLARPLQQARRGDSCDAAADDADVHARIAVERQETRICNRAQPEGFPGSLHEGQCLTMGRTLVVHSMMQSTSGCGRSRSHG